ncbi:MAG: hypothetical protein ACODTU_16915 [Pigmentiphaga sp.]|uniref:hypothetical protein n=1 Tax=Pigmentiphaga sp. TaxID=1977564 RepID=UPI003B56D8A8
MSLFAIEKVLWDICRDSTCAARYKADPASYLDAYALDAGEAELLRSLDVRGMVTLKVSPLLTMRAWQILRGRDQLPAYVKALNGEG